MKVRYTFIDKSIGYCIRPYPNFNLCLPKGKYKVQVTNSSGNARVYSEKEFTEEEGNVYVHIAAEHYAHVQVPILYVECLDKPGRHIEAELGTI